MNSASPNFFSDWSWFKQMPFEVAQNNEYVKKSYYQNLPLFIDYRDNASTINIKTSSTNVDHLDRLAVQAL